MFSVRRAASHPQIAFLVGVLALVVFYVGVAWLSPRSIGLLQDDAIYLSTAQALAEGEGYRHTEMPTQPWQTKYPILYPAVLSVAFRVHSSYPDNLPLLLLPTVLGGVGCVVLSFVYWRAVLRAPPRFSLLVVILVAFSPALVAFLRYAMSELIYASLSVGALLCVDLALRGSKKRWPLIVVGALLVGLAVLTRSIGVTLAAAGFATLLLRRHVKEAVVFAGIVAVCVLPWMGWQAWAAQQNGPLQTTGFEGPDLSYGLWSPDDPSQSVRTIKQNAVQTPFNLAYYQLALPPILATAGFTNPGWQRILLHVCSYFAALLCLVGFVVSARRRWHTLHTYAVLYGGLILVWPFDTTRFLVPWSPFLIYFIFVGIRAGALRVFGWRGVKATLLLAFVLLIVNFHHDLAKMHLSTPDSYFCREYYVDFEDLAELSTWIEANTSEDAVLASHHFGALYLETGRRGYPPWPASNPYDLFVGTEREFSTFYRHPAPGEGDPLDADMRARFAELYGASGVTHYVEWANGHETPGIRKVMEAHPDWFELVYTSPEPRGSFRVFEVRIP